MNNRKLAQRRLVMRYAHFYLMFIYQTQMNFHTRASKFGFKKAVLSLERAPCAA